MLLIWSDSLNMKMTYFVMWTILHYTTFNALFSYLSFHSLDGQIKPRSINTVMCTGPVIKWPRFTNNQMHFKMHEETNARQTQEYLLTFKSKFFLKSPSMCSASHTYKLILKSRESLQISSVTKTICGLMETDSRARSKSWLAVDEATILLAESSAGWTSVETAH